MADEKAAPFNGVTPALRAAIRRDYAPGWFVAVDADNIVAAEPDFRALRNRLLGDGIDPRTLMIVEAGAEEPEFVNIFSSSASR